MPHNNDNNKVSFSSIKKVFNNILTTAYGNVMTVKNAAKRSYSFTIFVVTLLVLSLIINK